MSTTAAIIIIGNEILSGRTQDVNVRFLAVELAALGICLKLVVVVPDEMESIIQRVQEASRGYTYVFTTGGIGPTHDDITAMAVAKAFNRRLVQDEDSYRALASHYGEENLTPARLKMAQVPEGSGLIHNPVSGAPGFRVDNVFVMAGVPNIMQGMFHNIKDQLQRGAPFVSRTIYCNLGESLVAQGLEDIQKKYPKVDIGSYPFSDENAKWGTNLVIKGTDAPFIDKVAEEVQDLVTNLGG